MKSTLHAHLSLGVFLVVALLVSGNMSYSQPAAKSLERSVRGHIAEYYAEEVTIQADSDGIITIEGEADNLFDKLKIGEIASEVNGVRGIVNNMIVHNDLTVDAEIESNIRRGLERNDAILEPEKIKVDVKQGVAYLSGSVSFFREKLLAQSIAAWQDGVSNMISTIQVLSPAAAGSDENLGRIIDDLLERSFPLEKNVVYTVHNAEVQLSGTVRSLYARNHIEEEIRRLLGVNNVINTLEVQKYAD